MSHRRDSGSVQPDLLIEEGHLGAHLYRLLGAESQPRPGESISQTILSRGMEDVAAMVTTIGMAMRSTDEPRVELPVGLQALHFTRRFARFVDLAARALEEANPPPPRDGGSEPDKG